MAPVVDELNSKRSEIGDRIDELRKEISELDRQQAAFDAVIAVYEPDYLPSG